MANGIVVFVETKSGELKKSAREVVTVGRQLADATSSDLTVLALGSGLEGKLDELGTYGANKVVVCDSDTLAQYNVHTFAPVLLEWIQKLDPQIVLGSATLAGKDLLPRVAAMLGVGMVSDCTEINWQNDSLKIKRPVYAGKAFIEATFSGKPPYVCSLRPNVFAAAEQGGSAAIEAADYSPPADIAGKLLEVQPGKSERADLTEADIIVSGGRSLKSQENFSILESLADALGATVGASRAAVDAGYASHDMQVGQTGKVVSPKLYMAFGISGAIQHLAGMRSSKVIVAINKDPEAPIFKKADYGIVGDLFELAPAIEKAAKELLG